MQEVPDGTFASAGQAAVDPVQFSATSHSPPADRQTVADDTKASAGHAALLPGQVSCTSHTPADERHTVPVWKLSAGHAAAEPVQFSALSHTPADDRQTTLDDWNASAGQLALDPLQVSCWSQTPADERHTVPLVANWQLDVQHPLFAMPVSHCSLTEASIVPLPQSEVNVIVTKWPSLDCVRLGLPG